MKSRKDQMVRKSVVIAVHQYHMKRKLNSQGQ
jgi:hypothetical protein